MHFSFVDLLVEIEIIDFMTKYFRVGIIMVIFQVDSENDMTDPR